MEQASRTAQFVALFRALETLRPADRRLFEDRLACELLDPELREVADRAAADQAGYEEVVARIDDINPGGRAWVVVRTKLIDDALRAALARGLDQVLLLGAGFDSRAHRIDGVDAVDVFEVDHPATQTVKRERVKASLGGEPGNVSYVPVDFDSQDPASELDAAGFRTGVRTFFLLEGVTSYLTEDAVDETVRFVGSAGGAGSEFAFTYLHRGILDGSFRAPGRDEAIERVASVGEPWRFGFDPDELPDYLAARGLELIDDVVPGQTAPPHLLASAEGASFYRLARARIGAH
jgi:methyltransferase (TIGR00027 family)